MYKFKILQFCYGDYIMGKIQNKYLEIKNINRDIVNWLEDIAEENNCRVVSYAECRPME